MHDRCKIASWFSSFLYKHTFPYEYKFQLLLKGCNRWGKSLKLDACSRRFLSKIARRQLDRFYNCIVIFLWHLNHIVCNFFKDEKWSSCSQRYFLLSSLHFVVSDIFLLMNYVVGHTFWQFNVLLPLLLHYLASVP